MNRQDWPTIPSLISDERLEPLTRQELARYHRNALVPPVGLVGQQRIRAARVLIVGAGGLGAPAALYLAAAGVGRLGIVDDDVVDLSNLQRQVIHTTARVGTPKADSAAQAVLALNPDIEVRPQQLRLTAGNAMGILRGWDLVIDGTDNFPTRYLLSDATVMLGLPLIHGAVLGLHGQVGVFDARRGPCYRCLHPGFPRRRARCPPAPRPGSWGSCRASSGPCRPPRPSSSSWAGRARSSAASTCSTPGAPTSGRSGWIATPAAPPAARSPRSPPWPRRPGPAPHRAQPAAGASARRPGRRSVPPSCGRPWGGPGADARRRPYPPGRGARARRRAGCAPVHRRRLRLGEAVPAGHPGPAAGGLPRGPAQPARRDAGVDGSRPRRAEPARSGGLTPGGSRPPRVRILAPTSEPISRLGAQYQAFPSHGEAAGLHSIYQRDLM